MLDGAVDRISRSLGFDRAGTRITLSGARFKRRRQDLGLDLKTIAAQATAAGVTVRTSDLLKLETAGALPFEQEVATVLVAILDTTLENIEDEFEREMTTVQAFLNGPRFEEVLAGWLDEHANQDPREVRAYVTDGVLAANFRAEDVSEEHLVDFVRALLRKFGTVSTRQGHARRIVAALPVEVRDDIAADPRSAIEVHLEITVQPASSFVERGARGWCDGMSESRSGVILYRRTPGRRENFTLAHELAHHLVDEDEDCPSWLADQPDPAHMLEEVCDDIASRLLISDDLFERALGGGKPGADTVAALHELTVASRTACLIAVANRLPCDGFALLVDPDASHRVFAAARARDTRPYAWKGDAIAAGHDLRRATGAARRSWWEGRNGDRRDFYVSVADVDGYTCAVFAENDLWAVEKLHTYTPVEPDRGNDAHLNCPSCPFEGTTRWWPCDTCGVLICPRCQACECTRREQREKRAACNRCFTVVRTHLLDEDGCCKDGC